VRRGFVRVLWGDFLTEDNEAFKKTHSEYGIEFDPENKMLVRRKKIETDIRKCMEQEFTVPFTSYTFGEANHRGLLARGISSVLLHSEPYKYHPTRGIYKHKLEAYVRLMDDFDEVVFLDWDTYLIKPLPDDFWEVLNEKDVFQASLLRYRTPRISHRDGLQNKTIPAGAFVYMRGKEVAVRLWELNKVCPNKWSCETAFAFLTDEITDGWKGLEEYWKRFEPEFYTGKRSPFKAHKGYRKEKICFRNGFSYEKGET